MPRNLPAWRVYTQVYDQTLTTQTVLAVGPLGSMASPGRQVLDLATVIKVIEFLEPGDEDSSLLLTKVRLFHDTIRGELADDGARR
ncbi:MAG: hypothetical protein V1806_03760 [Pseudomonadota bacterium]